MPSTGGRFGGGADAAQTADCGRAGGLQAAQGGGGTGLWTDQRTARISEISAARAGERGGGMEDDLRHAQPVETLPIRMEAPKRMKEHAQPTKLTYRQTLPGPKAQDGTLRRRETEER